MKLVDILARELKVWPEGVSCLSQLQHNGAIINGKGYDGREWARLQIAEDTPPAGVLVTEAEWQAAVDALNAPKVVEWEQGDIPTIGDRCEAYILAETEKQGHQMNRWASGKFIGKALADNGGIALLVECDDGWTHVINGFSYVRPERTAEQVAAEERENTINEALSILPGEVRCKAVVGQAVQIMIDAGYQKRVEK